MNRKWTTRELQGHVNSAKLILGLSDWKIDVRLARKSDFVRFKKQQKREKHLCNASTFYGLLMWCNPHNKWARIVINPKVIKNERELFNTIFHELLHIHLRRVSKSIGRGEISLLPIKGEETMIGRLVMVLDGFMVAIGSRQ